MAQKLDHVVSAVDCLARR